MWPEAIWRQLLEAWARTLAAADSCMRSSTVRLLSSKTFWMSAGRSPPPGWIPSKRCAYAPGKSYSSSFAFAPSFSLWLTFPATTLAWISFSASRCLCGSSKEWSHSVTFEDLSSWAFSQLMTRSSSRVPPPTASKIRLALPGRSTWLPGVFPTTIVWPPALCLKK